MSDSQIYQERALNNVTATKPVKKSNQTFRRLLTTDNYPIRYLPVQKCGCTFVKNVLWTLQFGSAHPNQVRVHDDEAKIPALEMTPENAAKIRTEDKAFIVIRNPAQRFTSLYFDKIMGSGRTLFPPLATLLAEKKGLSLDAATIEDHRRNCAILIDWIEENIESGTDLKKNPHWTPFTSKAKMARSFNLKVLLTSHLTHQLTRVLGPEIAALVPSLSTMERNSSTKSEDLSDLLDRNLKGRIKSVYREDQNAYALTRSFWKSGREAPRAGVIWADTGK
jgi:hypothetical protein